MRTNIFQGRRSIAATGAWAVLFWSVMANAQISGPTPQPEGVPVALRQAVQVERWAVYAQATGVWLLQPRFRSPTRVHKASIPRITAVRRSM
jgi:hypothetical protein